MIDRFFNIALLGEADLLTGQLDSPRSPPDALAAFQNEEVAPEDWIVQGICAYVPQVRSTRSFVLLIVRVENGFTIECVATQCIYQG